ncbi:MAG: hypothetical protein ABW128_11310 [Rhizorhabdus sp.]
MSGPILTHGPVTPLDRLTGGRIAMSVQWRARIRICQHLRGVGEIGPRWRVGSNARRPSAYEEAWSGRFEPCHQCGADGGELLSWQHYEFCPACLTEWPAGDYDWWRLADVLRFKADLEAGLIEPQPDSLIVHGYDVATPAGHIAFFMECARRRVARGGAGGAIDWDARERATMALARQARPTLCHTGEPA